MPGPIVTPRLPQKRRIAPHHAWIAVFLALAFGTCWGAMTFFMFNAPTLEERAAARAADLAAQRKDRDDGRQQERAALMKDLASEGLIADHGSDSAGRTWVLVDPTFLRESDKRKTAILTTIWYYYYVENGSAGDMDVRLDNGSPLGKRFMSYDPQTGY